MKKQLKTAAIYDRWLFTLGGGEQVAFAYAECLRDIGYAVTMITHQEIDRKKAEEKMGADLDGVKILYLPMMASEELAQQTEKYDVFINTSYLDYFPNRSKHGILSIFFPSQIFLTPYEYIKRAIVLPSFSNFFIYPSVYQGFKFDQYKNGRIYKWLGKNSSIIFNKDIRNFSITLFVESLGLSTVDGISFFIDTDRVYPTKTRIHDRNNFVSYSFKNVKTANRRFIIQLPEDVVSDRIALVKLTIIDFRYILYNAFKHYFPKWEMRLHGGPGVTKLSDLTSYHKIVTISDFSKFWIKKYWGLDSTIVYPPVAVENFKPSAKKKNWVLHVGRFFVTGHNKKQLDLVKVFRTLVDEKKLEGWELHFVGSVHEGEKHQQYFDQVKYYAQGYPVVFHLDAKYDELREVLAQSKIYWHATGLDEDQKRSPILFEHFGITTVEAMASGCVPVVINAGGQKEIVTKESGYLWDTRRQLLDDTWELITDSEKLKKMSLQAMKRSMYFSRQAFKERLLSVLQDKEML